MADIDLLIKLFDTLKDTMKDQNDAHHALLTNQNNIGNYIKTMPMEEIKQMLKEHAKESSSEIDSCTETVETKSDKILEEVKVIQGKIKTMVVVVLVSVSIFGLALLIGGIISQQPKEPSHSELEETIETQNSLIEDLKSRIEDFHTEDTPRKE